MRALIIGPKFHYFNLSVERAFRALGYETLILAYDNPVHPYTLDNKIRYKFAGDQLALKKESRALFHLEAELAFEEFLPDVVFVMNGDMLLSDTILHWRGQLEDDPAPVEKPAKVALWFFDSMTHIPLCEECISVVDAVFCYEQTDIPIIKERFGVDAHFLPQAVDTEIYYPISSTEGKLLTPHSIEPSAEASSSRQEHKNALSSAARTSLLTKKYDIVFAGDIFHSQKRRQVIQAVVAHYPSLRIKVWGEYKPWYKNPWKWLTRERKDIYMNRNASGKQLNEDYNQARIVLNIHHEQQKDGANPKVYEIAATCAYQICDANPYIEQLFPDGEIGLYTVDLQAGEEHRYDSLFACIDYALQHDMTAQAKAAYEKIVTKHTFIQRIQQCLDTLA